MATTTGFKQQCPNCEAIVPIRDEKLIGKRIKCPKCGEPFLLEEPDGKVAPAKTTKTARGAVNGAAAAKTKPASRRTRGEDDDEQPQFKKKKAVDSSKIMIGLGLAVVGVVALGVAAFFLFFNNSEPKKNTTPNTNVASNTNQNQTISSPTPVDSKPAIASTGADISNMLPADSQLVVNIPMEEVLKNPIGQLLFDNPAASDAQGAEGKLGFSMETVERWIITAKFSDPEWFFQIIRTKKPINIDNVKKALQLRPAEGSPIQGQDFFETPVNWIENSNLIPNFLKPEDRDSKQPIAAGTRPLTVRLHDVHTIVIADMVPMKAWLAVKGQPPFRDMPVNMGSPSSPEGGGLSPTAPGGPPGLAPALPSAPGGAQPVNPGGPPGLTPSLPGGPGGPIVPGFPGGQTPAFTGPNTYRSIDPPMKIMLDQMEINIPILISWAFNIDANPLVQKALMEFAFPHPVKTAGMSFQWRDKKMVAMSAVECANEKEADNVKNVLDNNLKAVAQFSQILGVKIQFGTPQNFDPSTAPNPGGGRGPGGVPLPPAPGGGGNPGAGVDQPPTPGGPGPGGPNPPKKPNEAPESITLTIDLRQQAKMVQMTVDIKLEPKVYDEFFKEVQPYLVRAQGEIEMATAKPNPAKLGLASRSYSQKEQQFPQGVFPRKVSPRRANRAWPPDQRISWMADLLPYLGYDRVYQRIDRSRSWSDSENLITASTLIPQFLSPNTPHPSWYISYPGVEVEVAATHYVGLSGIGLDSARYEKGDRAVADKLGIFGYDRSTRLGDIEDLARTIFMIQTPPTYKSPWLAGGGSTVRGVPETQCVQPFVTTGADGKKGTTVVMADGSVRWISADISDDVFKQLVRVKGLKSDVIIDKIAPQMQTGDQPELKASISPPPSAPKAETKPTPPPGK
ncbi:MAG TPA: DUF1559 domain-containing protein [Gemmataceae bacterium]|nr:DUF1559 domain-containing protein [Gemmataceae bacterium]